MGQNLSEIGSGVQHVGGNHQIKGLLESLLGRRSLNIQHLIAHKRIVSKPFFGLRQERGRDIREHIFRIFQVRQQMRRSSPCARAYFQNANRTSLLRKDSRDHLLHQRIHHSRPGRGCIQSGQVA